MGVIEKNQCIVGKQLLDKDNIDHINEFESKSSLCDHGKTSCAASNDRAVLLAQTKIHY